MKGINVYEADREYLDLQKKFFKQTGTPPEFEIIFETNRITVILEETNRVFQKKDKKRVPITGQGKTEISAKIKALRKFFFRG